MVTLHVTNGDSAVRTIRETGLAGMVIPWRDALHEGAVPAGLSPEALNRVRAEYIASRGWAQPGEDVLSEFNQRDQTLLAAAEADNIVLWFEHDLYDQLQLLQVLALLPDIARDRCTVAAPLHDEYLGALPPERLREVFDARQPLEEDLASTGRRAWAAFRASDPRDLLELVHGEAQSFPSLAGALIRHLEQYPSVENGLNRTERQILETLASGPMPWRELYLAAHHGREELIFMGDSIFADYLYTLAGGDSPLISRREGLRIDRSSLESFPATEIRITATGRSILAGEIDHLTVNGIDRWLGGVHLTGSSVRWRWDRASKDLHTTF